jgi:hypothetical protein
MCPCPSDGHSTQQHSFCCPAFQRPPTPAPSSDKCIIKNDTRCTPYANQPAFPLYRSRFYRRSHKMMVQNGGVGITYLRHLAGRFQGMVLRSYLHSPITAIREKKTYFYTRMLYNSPGLSSAPRLKDSAAYVRLCVQ